MDPAVVDLLQPALRARGIATTCRVMRLGELTVLPTGCGYALAGDLRSAQAWNSLERLLGRPLADPLPVLLGSWHAVADLATPLPATALELLRAFWPGELTVVVDARHDLVLPRAVRRFALRMPLHPVALDVIGQVGPIVSVPPPVPHESAATARDIKAALGRGAAYTYLEAGPPIISGLTTVVDCSGTAGGFTVLREGTISAGAIADAVNLVTPAGR